MCGEGVQKGLTEELLEAVFDEGVIVSDIINHSSKTVNTALDNLCVCVRERVCVCVCVCVCVRERERERENVCVCEREYVCMCVCTRERETLPHHLAVFHGQFHEVFFQRGQETLTGVFHEGYHLSQDLGHIM